MYNFMKKIRDAIGSIKNEKGQGMVEYAIVLAVVAIIATFVFWGTDGSTDNLQQTVKGTYDNAKTQIDAASKNTGSTTTETQSNT